MSAVEDPSGPEIAAGLLKAAQEGSTFHFTIERADIQPGKSFSRAALHRLGEVMLAWVEARVVTRWDDTGEPPTVLKVSVTVDVQ